MRIHPFSFLKSFAQRLQKQTNLKRFFFQSLKCLQRGSFICCYPQHKHSLIFVHVFFLELCEDKDTSLFSESCCFNTYLLVSALPVQIVLFLCEEPQRNWDFLLSLEAQHCHWCSVIWRECCSCTSDNPTSCSTSSNASEEALFFDTNLKRKRNACLTEKILTDMNIQIELQCSLISPICHFFCISFSTLKKNMKEGKPFEKFIRQLHWLHDVIWLCSSKIRLF